MKHQFINFRIGKKRNMGLRINIYLILWSLIIFVSIYLLIRFAAITFSKEIGQEKLDLKEVILYYCSDKVIESGSSFIRYTKNAKDEEGFFDTLFSRKFAMHRFLKEKSLLIAKAQEYAPTVNQKVRMELAGEESKKAVSSDGTAEETCNIAVGQKLKYDMIKSDSLSLEYILTNGTYYNEKQAVYYASNAQTGGGNLLEIDSLYGNLSIRENEEKRAESEQAVEVSNPGNVIEYTMEQLKDTGFLVRNFYIVDPATKVTESLFDAEKLLGKDMTMKQSNDAPQILIYHTHSQENYIDSKSHDEADTVVGIGSLLARILEEQYGYQVIHDKTTYDIIDGVLNRNKAYNVALDGIKKILEENPGIEVVIDLHRDGSPKKRLTVINGKETAQIMLFNGLSRDQNGPITYLENPYIQDNLAMSLQLQLKGIELYPGLFYKNYLNCYRYNMHVRKKSILMELGTDKNSLQSAENAMEPFARVLDAVLRGE